MAAEKLMALIHAVAVSDDPDRDDIYELILDQTGNLIRYVDAVYAQMTQLPIIRGRYEGQELLALTEKIASNVHDVWAVGRMAEGWTYGEKKDAQNLKNPLLVPYEELPESEKDYDRNTALETLKLIVKLGYEIRKKDGSY